MSISRSLARRAMALRAVALANSSRGGAGNDSARVRRAANAELSTGLRIGDGVKIKDGRMTVPVGAGLEIDSRGRVGSTAKLEIVNISTGSMNVVSATAGAALGLPSDIESSIGSGSISVDTANDWVRLEAGGAYSVEAHVVFDREIVGASTPGAAILFAAIHRRDDLDSADPPSSIIYTANGVTINPGIVSINGHEQVATIPMSAVIDLRSETAPAAIQAWARSTVAHANFTVMGHIKIERVG